MPEQPKQPSESPNVERIANAPGGFRIGSKCIVSQLTPTGRGAIATLLVQGERAADAVGHYFRAASGRPLAQCSLGRIVFGRWQTGDASAGEEVVVCRVAEDTVEVHCHGGRAAVAAITTDLIEAGCQELPWQDVVPRQYSDSTMADAHVALASATTQRTAAILLDQLHGALRDALAEVETKIAAGDGQGAMQLLDALRARADVGLHLTNPYRVVVAGRPNVGKSSLVNAILGYTRAIVFDQPGTTRDVLSAAAAIDGWPVELLDTAGLRESGDQIEQQGVARAKSTAQGADLVLLVQDGSIPPTGEDEALARTYPGALIVNNKSDLPQPTGNAATAHITLSALTGENLPELLEQIANRLVPTPPTAGDAVPFTQQHLDRIEELKAMLE